MIKLPLDRIARWRNVAGGGPVVCRRCGGTLGQAQVVLRDGRVWLEGFEGTARVRWTAEDELAFEHVRAYECEQR